MSTVTMPQLGESVTEGTILHWLKQPGDAVALDDSLCEIETEKVTAELPSPFEGRMGKILVAEGETVHVGAALCEVEEGAASPAGNGHAPAIGARPGGWSGGPMAIPPDEAAPAPAPTRPIAAAPAPPPAPAPAAVATAPVHRGPDARERFYSPAVLRLAAEHAVDLGTVHGSGIGGRVTRKDVEQAIGAVPAAAPALSVHAGRPTPVPAGGPYEVVALSPTRKTIAENLKRSNLEAPQAWTMVECDVTKLVALRTREKDDFARREGIDLTLLPYFASAVCQALRSFPMLNARWEGDELRRYRDIDLGVAVATETGLVVPVIHGAGELNVEGLSKRIADLADRARARKLRIEDIEGGTFTVNNTGVFGSITSKPIVNHPQVAIVTMERVVKRTVVVEGDAIAIRSMMNVCLSFDHRAMDGLEAGGFLAALKASLEAMG